MVTCPRCERCRSLQYDDFNLTHSDPALFVSFKFGTPWIAVFWNGAWFLFFLGTFIFDVISSRDGAWLVYHSNWCFILILTSTASEVIVRSYVITRRLDLMQGETTNMPWFYKVHWCLYNISHVTSLLQTVMAIAFWPSGATFQFINKHCVMSAYVIANAFIITSVPTKVFHFYQPVLLASVYIVFALIFQASSDTAINLNYGYKTADKASKSLTVILAVCLTVFAIPFIHLFMFCIYKTRHRVWARCSMLHKLNETPVKDIHSPRMSLQRDTTTTDVVIQKKKREFHYVEVRPEIKDDSCVKLNADRGRETALSGCSSRLNKSETDLRLYVSQNGFYCEFAPPSQISHYKDDTSLFDDRSSGANSSRVNSGHESTYGGRGSGSNGPKGSHMIVVKKCKSANDDIGGIDNEALSDTLSTVSSDYLSQYMTENGFVYT